MKVSWRWEERFFSNAVSRLCWGGRWMNQLSWTRLVGRGCRAYSRWEIGSLPAPHHSWSSSRSQSLCICWSAGHESPWRSGRRRTGQTAATRHSPLYRAPSCRQICTNLSLHQIWSRHLWILNVLSAIFPVVLEIKQSSWALARTWNSGTSSSGGGSSGCSGQKWRS